MSSPHDRSDVRSPDDRLNQSIEQCVDHSTARVHDQSTNQTNKRASSSTDHSRPDAKRHRSQQSSHSTNEITANHTSTISQTCQPLSVSDSLLTYAFLLPLVVEYVSDGDVVARLLIANKRIRRMLPKYSFKRMCKVSEAFGVIHASRDIMFSVTRVRSSWRDEPNELVRLEQMNSVRLIEVHHSCHDESSLNTIPRFVTHLTLSRMISDVPFSLLAGMIPDPVVDLCIDADLILQPDVIPSSVKTLKISSTLAQFNPAVIPDTVTGLTLTEDAEYATGILRGPFPNSLKRLLIGGHHLPFDADVIPPFVTMLATNSKALDMLKVGSIPDSVKHVEFDWYLEWAPKPGMLPDSVTSLHVSSYSPLRFVPQWLPAGLTHFTLHMPDDTTHRDMTICAGMMPSTLRHFRCNCDIEPGALPDGVTHVDLTYPLPGVLPPSVTHLKLSSSSSITPGLIPSSVTHLDLRCSSYHQLIPGVIPDSVTHLVLEHNFTCQIEPGVIPQTVTHLMYGKYIIGPLAHEILPCGLTHLWFHDKFNQSLADEAIPRTVTYLMFGDSFNQPILPGDIPSGVTHLAFGSEFTHELDTSNLPSSLTHLEIPRGYLKSDDKLWLPPSLMHISYKQKLHVTRPEMSWNNWRATTPYFYG